MCKALELAQVINDTIIEAKNYHYNLNNKLRTLDVAQQDLLHKIENLDKFNLMEAWEITKALNQIRHERRKIKNELNTMGIFINIIVEKQNADINLNSAILKLKYENKRLISLCENKSYTNRVLANKDLLKSTNIMLKNLNENNTVKYKNLVKDDITDVDILNNTKGNINTTQISKIYNFGEKQLKKDKTKGSSIKMRYVSQRQYDAIKNLIVPQYNSFCINTSEKYFDLVNKKF